MVSPAVAEPDWRSALETSVSALKRVAGYTLDPALDRRVLDLGERKESLTPAEHAELLAWVAFTQQLSLDKLKAELALRRLAAVYPNADGPS